MEPVHDRRLLLCRSTRLVHRLCILLTTAGARRPHARQSGCRGVAQSSCVTLPPPRADEPAWVAGEACVATVRGGVRVHSVEGRPRFRADVLYTCSGHSGGSHLTKRRNSRCHRTRNQREILPSERPTGRLHDPSSLLKRPRLRSSWAAAGLTGPPRGPGSRPRPCPR